MNADEKREQKMRLKLEIEDAESNLNSLREKARVRADQIIQFGTWLKTAPETHIYRHGIAFIMDNTSLGRYPTEISRCFK